MEQPDAILWMFRLNKTVISTEEIRKINGSKKYSDNCGDSRNIVRRKGKML
jgi:hypothetical protein